MTSKTHKAIGTIREAVEVRKQITELYKQYREFSNLAVVAAELNNKDVKRAVDALYYFGGGWPSPTSKGRMEALLENFVGMYRILDFIGEGNKVHEHLAMFGVTVSLANEFKITNRELTHNERAFLKSVQSETDFTRALTIKDLVTDVILECQELQSEICDLADKIKEELRPQAQEALGLEDPEYDRLHDIVRMTDQDTPKAADNLNNKKVTITKSMTAFNIGVSAVAVTRK